MPAQLYPYPVDLAWEIFQDNIQVPHLVNPRTYVIDSGDTTVSLDYDGDWGTGTGHRYLFVMITHAPMAAATPTYNGVAMTAVGTPGATGGLWRLANPALSGNIVTNIYTGTSGDKATVFAVMFVGAREIAPAFTHQSSGTWDSTNPLVIQQSYGSRQSVLTFLEFYGAYGDLSSTTDHLVPRPGALGSLSLAVALSSPTGGSGTWNTSIAGSAAASGAYRAYGVSLFHVAAQNGAQVPNEMPWQAWSVWPPAATTDQHTAQALRRLPAQFDSSPRVRAVVSGICAAFDASSARWANARQLMHLSEAHGAHLDVWGARLAFPRLFGGEYLSDLDYRRMLLAIMLARRSSGTYPELRAVAKIIFGDVAIAFTEPAAATILLTVTGRTIRQHEQRAAEFILRQAVSVGVALSVA